MAHVGEKLAFGDRRQLGVERHLVGAGDGLLQLQVRGFEFVLGGGQRLFRELALGDVRQDPFDAHRGLGVIVNDMTADESGDLGAVGPLHPDLVTIHMAGCVQLLQQERVVARVHVQALGDVEADEAFSRFAAEKLRARGAAHDQVAVQIGAVEHLLHLVDDPAVFQLARPEGVFRLLLLGDVDDHQQGRRNPPLFIPQSVNREEGGERLVRFPREEALSRYDLGLRVREREIFEDALHALRDTEHADRADSGSPA